MVKALWSRRIHVVGREAAFGFLSWPVLGKVKREPDHIVRTGFIVAALSVFDSSWRFSKGFVDRCGSVQRR
jgi:hypothetical protein